MNAKAYPNSDSESYAAPTSAEIAKRQNEQESLRLLLAQRRLYSRAKGWLALRMWGMGFIAIAAPIVAFIWPKLSILVGAIAGAWIFLGRTLFLSLEKNLAAQAAGVQELFDIRVFRMPQLGVRSPLPTLEDLSNIAGSETEIQSRAEREALLNWYPVNPDNNGLRTVAICQRANASYARSLLSATSRAWLCIISGWTVALIVISFLLRLTLSDFLLAVLLPLLPAFLDAIDFWRAFSEESTERENLTLEIEGMLRANKVTPEEVVIWQTRLYDIRRDMPQVPDWLYRFTRKRNEQAMAGAAGQLSDAAREDK